MLRSYALTSLLRKNDGIAPVVELLEPRHMLSAGVSAPNGLRHASHRHVATRTGTHTRHYHLPAVLSTAQIVAVGSGNQGLASADFNGDGKADLVATNVANDSVSILLGDGHGAFAAGIDATIGASTAPGVFGDVITGDFNHDSKADVAVRHSQDASDLYVLLGNGDGTLRPVQHSSGVGSQSPLLAVTDANVDGNPDIIEGGNAKPLFGNGDGTFHQVADNFVEVDATGDFNGDGRLDEINLTSPTGVETSLGQADGTFVFTGTSSPFPTSLPPLLAGAAVSGQFNSDSHLDLALLTTGGVYLMPGLGNGNFGAGAKISDLVGGGLATGDINGDGKADILLVPVFSDTLIQPLLGNGAGVFSRGADMSVPASSDTSFLRPHFPNQVAIADFNADGKQDVAVPRLSSGQVYIFFGL